MSFPVSKIFIHFHLYKFVYVPIYFTNNKNSIRRVIWSFIYTSKIKLHIKDNTWNVIILTIIQKMFAKFDGKKVEFIRIGMYGLVSNENRYIMWENILELQTLITFKQNNPHQILLNRSLVWLFQTYIPVFEWTE